MELSRLPSGESLGTLSTRNNSHLQRQFQTAPTPHTLTFAASDSERPNSRSSNASIRRGGVDESFEPNESSGALSWHRNSSAAGTDADARAAFHAASPSPPPVDADRENAPPAVGRRAPSVNGIARALLCAPYCCVLFIQIAVTILCLTMFGIVRTDTCDEPLAMWMLICGISILLSIPWIVLPMIASQLQAISTANAISQTETPTPTVAAATSLSILSSRLWKSLLIFYRYPFRAFALVWYILGNVWLWSSMSCSVRVYQFVLITMIISYAGMGLAVCQQCTKLVQQVGEDNQDQDAQREYAERA